MMPKPLENKGKPPSLAVSKSASSGTRTRNPKRSILSRLRIPISPWRLCAGQKKKPTPSYYATSARSKQSLAVIQHDAVQQTMLAGHEGVDALAMILICGFRHLGKHTVPHQCAAADHIDASCRSDAPHEACAGTGCQRHRHLPACSVRRPRRCGRIPSIP